MARKRKKRKSSKKRKTRRSGKIPLPILKRRLAKLSRIVSSRS